MKSIRFALMFLIVLAVASIAEAQCLKCYPDPYRPGSIEGTCGPHFEGDWCTRQCCDAMETWPCSVVDFIDPCDWWLSAPNDTVVAGAAKPARTRPDRAFTSRLLPDTNNLTMKRFNSCRS